MKKNWIDRILLPAALLTAAVWIATASRLIAVPAEAKAENSIELPILMYHHIQKDTSRLNDYTITPDAFRSDLEWLRQQGYTTILVQDLINYVQQDIPLPDRPVMITFDDGYESFYAYAFPILKELNSKAVFSVVGRYTDQYSEIDDHHVAYSHCNWDQLLEMQESGIVEIQNHSYNLHHNKEGGRKGARKLPGESDEAYRQALTLDLGKLQEECALHLGRSPTAFAFPYGFITPQAFDILKEIGFQAAFTCEEKLNYLTKNPNDLMRLRRFNRPNGKSAEAIFRRAGATLSPLTSK